MNNICLNMIVKNESKVIERCIRSARAFGITSWCILDTGSTDGTPELIWKELNDIPGEMHYASGPLLDYSKARNEALDLAKTRCTGDWILFMDAKSELVIPDGFEMCPLDLNLAGYKLWLWHGAQCFNRVTLINSRFPWHWQGVLHEECVLPEDCKKPVGEFHKVKAPRILIHPGEGCRGQDSERFKKDAAILEAYLADHPDARRERFFLAQSYRDGGEWYPALLQYQKVLKLFDPTEREDRFEILLSIARIEEKRPDDQTVGTVVDAYLAAALTYPEREPEATGRLGYYLFKNGWMNTAHVMALRCQGAMPEATGNYVVDLSWYVWRCLDLLAVTAFYVGDYALALKSLDELLTRPVPEEEMERITRNREQAVAAIAKEKSE